MSRQVVNLTKLVDESRLSAVNYLILGLTFIATLTEGFDVTATAYTAPGIIAEWHVSRAMLAPVFSVAPLGMLFGSTLLGYVGDRFGRKVAMLTALASFGSVSIVCAFVDSLQMLIALRFIMGVGAGGLLTNNISLISEYTPARRRPGFVMLVAMGMTIGGITVALTSAALPEEAWRTIFLIGGIAPLIMLFVLMFLLPESIKYLAAHPTRKEEARRIARRMLPDAVIDDDADIVVENSTSGRKPSFSLIFAGRLALITPLVWVVFICVQAANIGLSSWLPTILHDHSMSHDASAVTASMYYFGGVLGAFTIGRALDRYGFVVLMGTFLLAIPVVVAVGIKDSPQWVKMITIFMTGYAVLGTQLGSNTAGIIYPSAFRSIGYGTASAVGRIGAIGGPIVFGLLMTLGLPLHILLLAPAIPLVIGAVTILVVAKLVSGRFFGGKIQEVPLPSNVAADLAALDPSLSAARSN